MYSKDQNFDRGTFLRSNPRIVNCAIPKGKYVVTRQFRLLTAQDFWTRMADLWWWKKCCSLNLLRISKKFQSPLNRLRPILSSRSRGGLFKSPAVEIFLKYRIDMVELLARKARACKALAIMSTIATGSWEFLQQSCDPLPGMRSLLRSLELCSLSLKVTLPCACRNFQDLPITNMLFSRFSVPVCIAAFLTTLAHWRPTHWRVCWGTWRRTNVRAFRMILTLRYSTLLQTN